MSTLRLKKKKARLTWININSTDHLRLHPLIKKDPDLVIACNSLQESEFPVQYSCSLVTDKKCDTRDF